MKLDHYDPIMHRRHDHADLGTAPTGWQRHRVALAIAAVLGSLGMVLAVASSPPADTAGSSSATR